MVLVTKLCGVTEGVGALSFVCSHTSLQTVAGCGL